MEWELFQKGVFLVNLLGIIYDPSKKQILIGKRVNDPNIKELTWVFPGGRPDYNKDLEVNLLAKIKEDTNLDVLIKNVFFAKTYPEKREFLSIYYYCEFDSARGSGIPGGSLKELKWVKPSEVTDYFTTSIHGKVLDYLKTLE
jgi:ADP-ribose pyrophosphatase YjhB (NUDIX family)